MNIACLEVQQHQRSRISTLGHIPNLKSVQNRAEEVINQEMSPASNKERLRMLMKVFATHRCDQQNGKSVDC